MATRTLLTLDEFMVLPDNGSRQELVEGELLERPPAGSRHTAVARRIERALICLIEGISRGEVYVEAAYRLRDEPPVVRVPDVSVLGAGRQLPEDEKPFFGAPDLAIEVVSPSDAADDLRAKTAQYLALGVAEVWVVYPKFGQVDVHRLGESVKTFSAGESIPAPPGLGEWSLPVDGIFG